MTSESRGLRQGTPSLLRQVAEQISHLWWVPLLTGVFSIGLGLAFLATDWTLQALVIVTGIVFIFRGIDLAFSPAYASKTSGEQIAAGVIGVIAGIVLLAWPKPTLLVLAFFVGAWLAVSGCFHIVTSIAHRGQLTQWGVTLTLGIIELLLGIWAMRRPEATLNLIIVIIGLWAVTTGVIYCVLAFELRNTGRAIVGALSGREDPHRVADQIDRLDLLARLRTSEMISAEEYAQLKEALLAAHEYAPGGDGHPDGAATPPQRQTPRKPDG